MKRAALILAPLLWLIPICAAQNAGEVAIQTVNQTAFSGQATAPATFVVRNIGQSAHWLIYCPNSATAVITIAIEAAGDNAGPWVEISPEGTAIGTQCGVLQAAGYFKNVRVNLSNLNGSGAQAVSAWYSGTAGPIGSNPAASYQSNALSQTTNNTTSEFLLNGFSGVYPQTCVFYLTSTDGGGGNTLNVYIQDADVVGAIPWNDRVSFQQIVHTTGPFTQVASITSAGSTGLVPTALTDGSLAAGSIRAPGPLLQSLRVKAVAAGGPFTWSLIADCK